VKTIIAIAIGVAIGILCPPLGLGILFWYYFLRGKR